MTEIRFSPDALSDLQQIHAYITEELCSESAARHTVARIIKRIRTLSAFPQSGARLSAIIGYDTDYRYLACGSYTVFYRNEKDRVMIIRVLYSGRDYMRVLFDEDQSTE